MGYVPTRHYAEGWEILEHCRAIARRYELYDLAVFQTTVTSTVWHADEQLWHLTTDRGDRMTCSLRDLRERHAVEAELAKIAGMGTFARHSFHTSRWDYDYTGANLENLHDKVVGIIGTGATRGAVDSRTSPRSEDSRIPGAHPSSIITSRTTGRPIREWAAKLQAGWQASAGRRR